MLSDIENTDVVIHLAGISNDPLNKLTSKSVYDPTRIYTLKIARYCKALNKKFILRLVVLFMEHQKQKDF